MKRMRDLTAALSPRACCPIRVPTSPILLFFARERKEKKEEKRTKDEQQDEMYGNYSKVSDTIA